MSEVLPPPLPEGPNTSLLTPTRIWVSVLALVSSGLVAGSIVYSFNNLKDAITGLQLSVDEFNVAEQEFSWQTTKTQALTEHMETNLKDRSASSDSDDICTVDDVVLIHTGGNAYDGQVTYTFSPVTRITGNDLEIDTRFMRQFQCRLTITSDGIRQQWHLDGSTCDAPPHSLPRMLRACHG